MSSSIALIGRVVKIIYLKLSKIVKIWSTFCWKCSFSQRDFKLTYNAEEALKYINYQHRENNYYKKEENSKVNGISFIPDKLQIKHAEQWKNLEKPKNIEITEIQESSDSFYVTPFKGFLAGKVKVERTEEQVIPVHKLGPQN